MYGVLPTYRYWAHWLAPFTIRQWSLRLHYVGLIAMLSKAQICSFIRKLVLYFFIYIYTWQYRSEFSDLTRPDPKNTWSEHDFLQINSTRPNPYNPWSELLKKFANFFFELRLDPKYIKHKVPERAERQSQSAKPIGW